MYKKTEKEHILNKEQMLKIEELLMLIPTKICRNMNLRFVNHILKDITDKIAKHHFMILKMLQENEKLYVTEIVHSLGITKSQMTASVDKLLKLEYVERWTDNKDRRKIFIKLTESGEEITEKINSRIKERFYEDIKILNPDELNDLESGLKVLHKLCSISEQKN